MGDVKKKIAIVFIVILTIIIVWVSLVKLLSISVEKELNALQDYSKLCSSPDFKWEKRNYIFFHEYRFESSTDEYYDVFPIGGFYVSNAVKFSSEEYKDFPEDLLKEQYSYGDFYLPQDDYNFKDWNSVGSVSISFDKGYSIEELKEKLYLGEIKWLWVDTYGDSLENTNDAMSKYEIFGILISGQLENSDDMIQTFIDILNKYDSTDDSIIGQKIHSIKKNIKEKEDISIDDLRIIGCVSYLSETERLELMDNYTMIKVVK